MVLDIGSEQPGLMTSHIALQFMQNCITEPLSICKVRNSAGFGFTVKNGLLVSEQMKLLLYFQGPPIPKRFPLTDFKDPNGIIIEATTTSGWRLETKVFQMVAHAFSAEHNSTSWQVEILILNLSRAITEPPEDLLPVYESFIDPVLHIYENSSEYVKEGQTRPSYALDRLEVKKPEGTIQVLRGEAGWSLLRVEMNSACSQSEYSAFTSAFIKALSVRMGRRIDLFSTTTQSNDREIVILHPFNRTYLKHTGHLPLVPLAPLNGQGANFVSLVMTYFQNEPDSVLLKHLLFLWNAELTSREIHRLQLAIALEGFSEYVDNIKAPDFTQSSTAQRKIDKKKFSALKQALKNLLPSIDAEEKYKRRMIDVLNHGKFSDAAPKIQAAGASLGVTITEKELKLWKGMRNAAAHGEFPEIPEDEIDFWTCLSIFYRMVLKSLGWSGPIVQYGPAHNYVSRPDTSEVVQTFSTRDIGIIEKSLE